MEVDALSTQIITDSDLDLRAVVRDVLNQLDLVRGSRAKVSAHVAAGRVTLNGFVQSPMVAVEVERAVAGVPGTTSVDNQLVDDGTLTRRLGDVLSTDPATSSIPPGYEITSVFGQVTLIGRFSDAEARDLMAVAQAVPGVRSVNVKTY